MLGRSDSTQPTLVKPAQPEQRNTVLGLVLREESTADSRLAKSHKTINYLYIYMR